ncbi:hypothetical protein GCM10007205_08170 [Oxalicibacterium flavum]|uniref:Uncharacterized protein n=1 Tax=Oxalicibacterium flavum TaxID=179467 RepID=A0A8J2UPE0_9BURK|nr:hypothetical protein [Oxalicibacterium flavum]GGC01330.1 hypothetical protein GCM10007205_08170 [Oxalicibacterium flavum]
MKTWIEIHGCFPALRTLDARQFSEAIAQRLIDIRNPATGLQVDLFGKVGQVEINEEQGRVRAELDIDDAFFSRHGLTREQIDPLLAARVSKLRHPATGAMHPVSARLS